MNTKALIYKASASASAWNSIWASSTITLTNAQRRHRRSTQMIPVGMRKQAYKALPTFQEMASQRIAVLDAAIAAVDSREDANPKKLKKRAQHLAEKADLERQLSQPAQGQHGVPNSGAARGTLVMYVDGCPADLFSYYSWKLSVSANVLTLGLVTEAMRLRQILPCAP